MLGSVKNLVKKTPALQPTDSVKKAADFMAKEGFLGLAVVDKENKPVGILTDGDLLNAFYSNVTNYSYELKSPHSKQKFDDRVKRFASTAVSEVMSLKPKCVAEGDGVEKAVELLKKNRIKRLVVTDENGFYVGLLERLDVARSLL